MSWRPYWCSRYVIVSLEKFPGKANEKNDKYNTPKRKFGIFKKSKKKDELEKPKAYKSDSALDYSKPLGDINLYKRQGVANFGPYTESKDPWLALSSILSLGNKKEG